MSNTGDRITQTSATVYLESGEELPANHVELAEGWAHISNFTAGSATEKASIPASRIAKITSQEYDDE